MRIGVDFRFTQASHTGTGSYAETALRQLASVIHAEEELFAFISQPQSVFGLPDNVTPVLVNMPSDTGSLQERLYLDSAIAKKQLDVFWAPTSIAPLIKTCPVVISIHDLLFEQAPEYYTPGLLQYLRAEIRRSAEEADAVIAISRHTEQELLRYYHTPADKVRVIHQGLREIFWRRPEKHALAKVLKKLDIRSPYVLMLSNHAAHKNSAFGLQAFAQWVRVRADHRFTLVVAGGGMSPSRPTDFAAVAAASGIEDRVKMVGRVDDTDLPALFAGASAFLFPSIYEGWGLPPLEAIALDTPVVASDGGALPEAIGDAGYVLPPDDLAKWVAALEQLLTKGPALRIKQAMKRRRQELLRSPGAAYLEVLRKVARQGNLPAIVRGGSQTGISGCTIVRNAVALGYPLRASVASYAPICEEIVLAWDPTSTDATRELVQQIAAEFPQVRLIESCWDMTNRTGGTEIARQTNIAFAQCRQPWTLYVQADEALHEDAHAELRQMILNPECGGIAFSRHSFLRSLNDEIPEHRVSGLVRLFRTERGQALGDAMQCGVDKEAGAIVASLGRLFNYSRLGCEDAILKRCRNLHAFYHIPEENIKTADECGLGLTTESFSGSHPAPIEKEFRSALTKAPSRHMNRPEDYSTTIPFSGDTATPADKTDSARVSVHIIAREIDELGGLFFRSCLESLRGYADEVVIVDNGCDPHLIEQAGRMQLGCPLNILPLKEERSFSRLRNAALQATDSSMTHVHAIDTDEIYFPESLAALKQFLATSTGERFLCGSFHFMIEPTLVAGLHTKPVIFKHTPTLKWDGLVHESIAETSGRDGIESPGRFLHLGYCRPQWQTMLKWLQYAHLQDGNLEHYKAEYVDGVRLPWFWNKKSPDEILELRRPYLHPYKQSYPASVAPWLEDYARSGKSWREWSAGKTDNTLWAQWLQKFQNAGNWENTLDEMLSLANPGTIWNKGAE